MALPRTQRLYRDKDIQEVFRLGKSFRGTFLLLKFRPTGDKTRFAYQIPTKVLKKAVDRNRLRRKLGQISGHSITNPSAKHGAIVTRLLKGTLLDLDAILYEYEKLLRDALGQ